jgi:hypothetical protein
MKVTAKQRPILAKQERLGVAALLELHQRSHFGFEESAPALPEAEELKEDDEEELSSALERECASG